MKFDIIGHSIVTLEHIEGEPTSKHITTQYNLDVSKNVDRKNFFDDDNVPNQAGSKALSQCFLQGLIANIHYANSKGYRNIQDHIKYIQDELSRGISMDVKIDVAESNLPGHGRE